MIAGRGRFLVDPGILIVTAQKQAVTPVQTFFYFMHVAHHNLSDFIFIEI